MAKRAVWIVAALLALVGCNKPNDADPKAEIVAETLRHLERLGPAAVRLTRVSEVTPAAEVAGNLRFVARDLGLWQRDYRMLRAKMLLRQVSQAQHKEVNRKYAIAMDDVKRKMELAERRLGRRSDTTFFIVDLQRVRQLVREL
jgi:hypothetical protein